MKPEFLIKLTNELSKLPGVSKKRAEKLAYFILTEDKFDTKEFSDGISESVNAMQRCLICGVLSDKKICDICLSQDRDRTLFIVENSLDVFKFEEIEEINPYYHVLNDLVDPTKNNNFDRLNIKKLRDRAENFDEIVIALSPNMNGLLTTRYIANELQDLNVTEIAIGIPIGANMEYVDINTLKLSLNNRKENK